MGFKFVTVELLQTVIGNDPCMTLPVLQDLKDIVTDQTGGDVEVVINILPLLGTCVNDCCEQES
jgi:hypothetical protein